MPAWAVAIALAAILAVIVLAWIVRPRRRPGTEPRHRRTAWPSRDAGCHQDEAGSAGRGAGRRVRTLGSGRQRPDAMNGPVRFGPVSGRLARQQKARTEPVLAEGRWVRFGAAAALAEAR